MAADEKLAQARRLIAAANELLAIARELERDAAEPVAERAASTRAIPLRGRDDPIYAELARQAYRDRRKRAQIFGAADLFGEPAWDILLDLFIAAKERKLVPVTSACIGAAVPPTTALRWIAVLEEQGLVVRADDEADARRVFVRLSAKAYEGMVEFFESASRPWRNAEWDHIVDLEEAATAR